MSKPQQRCPCCRTGLNRTISSDTRRQQRHQKCTRLHIQIALVRSWNPTRYHTMSPDHIERAIKPSISQKVINCFYFEMIPYIHNLFINDPIIQPVGCLVIHHVPASARNYLAHLPCLLKPFLYYYIVLF